MNAVAGVKLADPGKTSGAKALNKTVKVKLTKAAAFVLPYGFENFLFFCLHFKKTFMMALQPRNNKSRSLKLDIVMK